VVKFKLRIKLRKRVCSWLGAIFIIFLWAALITFIFFVPPRQWWIIALFLMIFSLSIYLTIVKIYQNKHLALLIDFFIVSLTLLQLFRQVHWLNLLLLAAFCLAILFHWQRQ